MRAYRVIW